MLTLRDLYDCSCAGRGLGGLSGWTFDGNTQSYYLPRLETSTGELVRVYLPKGYGPGSQLAICVEAGRTAEECLEQARSQSVGVLAPEPTAAAGAARPAEAGPGAGAGAAGASGPGILDTILGGAASLIRAAGEAAPGVSSAVRGGGGPVAARGAAAPSSGGSLVVPVLVGSALVAGAGYGLYRLLR